MIEVESIHDALKMELHNWVTSVNLDLLQEVKRALLHEQFNGTQLLLWASRTVHLFCEKGLELCKIVKTIFRENDLGQTSMNEAIFSDQVVLNNILITCEKLNQRE